MEKRKTNREREENLIDWLPGSDALYKDATHLKRTFYNMLINT